MISDPGPAGVSGPAGPQGAAGAPGPPGASGGGDGPSLDPFGGMFRTRKYTSSLGLISWADLTALPPHRLANFDRELLANARRWLNTGISFEAAGEQFGVFLRSYGIFYPVNVREYITRGNIPNGRSLGQKASDHLAYTSVSLINKARGGSPDLVAFNFCLQLEELLIFRGLYDLE